MEAETGRSGLANVDDKGVVSRGIIFVQDKKRKGKKRDVSRFEHEETKRGSTE